MGGDQHDDRTASGLPAGVERAAGAEAVAIHMVDADIVLLEDGDAVVGRARVDGDDLDRRLGVLRTQIRQQGAEVAGLVATPEDD
jgi:hypothetical protein